MGATVFTMNAKGRNVNEVFDSLYEEAIMMHGHDSYNGTISTTSLSNEVNIPENIKKNREKLSEYINDEKNDRKLYPSKWETTYADLGPSHYEAFTPTWVDDKRTPQRQNGVKTINEFSLVTKKDGRYVRGTYKTLTEAKRAAKEAALARKEAITIKKHRSNGDRFTWGHFELTSDGKEYKSARKAKNKIYMPINEYIFFVYAAC